MGPKRPRSVEAEDSEDDAGQRALLAAREKCLFRMVERDAVWQAQTNRLARVTGPLPDDVAMLVRAGAQAFERKDLEEALQSFQAASAQAGGQSKEIIDNWALTALLLGRNEECVDAANVCLQLFPDCFGAYLHKARALRCLQQFDAATSALTAALPYARSYAPDLQRERQLLGVEQLDRKTAAEVPDHHTALGVSEQSTTAAITQAFRLLAMKWHPDRWVASDAEDQLAAGVRFRTANEAHETLLDPERRAAWEEGFRKQRLIRTAPHQRPAAIPAPRKSSFYPQTR